MILQNPQTINVVYADGCCEPRNPGGWACWAWVALDTRGRPVADERGCLGHGRGMTNNIAEYEAAIRALTAATANGWTGFVLRTDSQLVVNQVTGGWACRAAHLRPLRDRVQTLLKQTAAKVEWVPGEKNKPADRLSRLAYKEARGGGW